MKLIIELDDELYYCIKQYKLMNRDVGEVEGAICNGKEFEQCEPSPMDDPLKYEKEGLKK